MSTHSSGNSALLIFQKNTVLGKAKTRIASTVGDEKALEIYQKLIAYTHLTSKAVTVKKYLFFSDFLEQVDETQKDFSFAIQNGKDLGERMANAFQIAFDSGFDKVVLIGTDCGKLTSEMLENAFEFLDSQDLVLGPAADGGYYLIGLNRPEPFLFMDMQWSTSEVLAETLKKAKQIKLDSKLLPVLSDVDTYADWLKQKDEVESFIKQEQKQGYDESEFS